MASHSCRVILLMILWVSWAGFLGWTHQLTTGTGLALSRVWISWWGGWWLDNLAWPPSHGWQAVRGCLSAGMLWFFSLWPLILQEAGLYLGHMVGWRFQKPEINPSCTSVFQVSVYFMYATCLHGEGKLKVWARRGSTCWVESKNWWRFLAPSTEPQGGK